MSLHSLVHGDLLEHPKEGAFHCMHVGNSALHDLAVMVVDFEFSDSLHDGNVSLCRRQVYFTCHFRRVHLRGIRNRITPFQSSRLGIG